MKTAEKIASGWLLLLGFMFLLLPASTVNRGSTQNQNMPICSTPNVNEARDTAIGGLILGVPSVLLGGLLALGAYRQGQQEKAIAPPAGDRLHSAFFRLLQAGNGYITILQFALEAQLTATAARQYLDERAKEFDATFDVSHEGAISYYFPGLNTAYIPASSSDNKQQFDIILEDSGKNRIAVIKVITELTYFGLKEAKYLVESTPTVLKTKVTKALAEDIKKQLEEVGAKVTIL
ncbi:MAG: ribosomal protein L7/L12 [Gloeocapsa sp. UFS-A4-WI-NPMV-4B04]|jgi:ribosomal protein L7/L12|nr:ribosomal protein L7/L12 [Gloeocapsa sp. UFS-A4-WI-NPMV-4B04]